MYEYMRGGLGYAPVLQEQTWSQWWNDVTPDPKPCLERPGGVEVCFSDTPSERSIANDYDCDRMGFRCTERGHAGATWCCPPMILADQPSSDPHVDEVDMEEESVVVTPPPTTPPRPFATHTTVGRLTHPGALMAMSLGAVGLFFLYRQYQASREVTF